MGKGKRLKAARAATIRREIRSNFGLLQEAVIAVGDAYGEEANCADAAALLAAAAAELGFQVAPRPVALFAHDRATGDFAFMGPKANALIPPNLRSQVEDHRPDGMDNGHLVLTIENPPMLIDANLRQLGAMGMQAPSLMLNVGSTAPKSGEWSARIGGLDLVYLLDEDHRVLVERFDEVIEAARPDAKHLVGMLRSGLTADQIRSLLVDRR